MFMLLGEDCAKSNTKCFFFLINEVFLEYYRPGHTVELNRLCLTDLQLAYLRPLDSQRNKKEIMLLKYVHYVYVYHSILTVR